MRGARVVVALVCAAATGALLFSVQVATLVFGELMDDRLRAGRVAGRAFVAAYGIAAGAALFAVAVVAAAPASRGERAAATAFLAISLVELFWIAPSIVRHGVGWPGTFASLHATGGALHLGLAAIGLFLAWRLLARPH